MSRRKASIVELLTAIGKANTDLLNKVPVATFGFNNALLSFHSCMLTVFVLLQDGLTPLHIAAFEGDSKNTALLLSAGASLEITNSVSDH